MGAGYFEVADTVESARDSGKWKAADRVVTDAAVNVSTNAFQIASTAAAWVATSYTVGGGLGKTLWVVGAGTSGAAYVGFAKNSVDSHTVDLRPPASTTVSGAMMNIGIKTIDGTHPSSSGHYLMSQAVDPNQLWPASGEFQSHGGHGRRATTVTGGNRRPRWTLSRFPRLRAKLGSTAPRPCQ
jgi:hypothetical protein